MSIVGRSLVSNVLLRMKKMVLWFVLIGTGLDGASPPNIVFVFSDDHATQAISAYGGILAEVAPTPHLDRLNSDGIRFDRCMVHGDQFYLRPQPGDDPHGKIQPQECVSRK